MEERDKKTIQELAVRQVEKGANMLDLNIGPQRKTGVEVMRWMVNTVQEVVDVPLSLDTTNAAAIEAGLQLCRHKPLINSTDTTQARLEAMMPLAARYGANIIALTLGEAGLPSTADARIELAVEKILPVASEHGVPIENIYLDPLVLTVNGSQDQAMHTIAAVRFFKQLSDPPPMTTCGLSNVSNGAPRENRPLINRVYLVMMLAAGIDSAIVDAQDDELMKVLCTIESRDGSTPEGRLYLKLYDTMAADEEFDTHSYMPTTKGEQDILKTIEILQNRWIYAHSYLQV